MNNVKIISLPLTCILGVSGCATTQAPIAPIAPIIYTDVSLPSLDVVTTKTLGEILLTQGMGYYADSITIEPLDAHAADFTGGVFYNSKSRDHYESNEKNTVTINNGYGFPLRYQNYIHYDRKKNKICTQAIMGACYDTSEMNFTHNTTTQFRVKPNSFQRVIEYNGKSGNTLKFTYREFSDNRVRQSFTTNFTMDLSDGNKIGYKGALLEVLKASNNVIEYKVIKNFNKTQK